MAYKSQQREYTGGERPMAGSSPPMASILPHVDEQTIIREALELSASGLSLRKIGAGLASRGILPRQGKLDPRRCASLCRRRWPRWPSASTARGPCAEERLVEHLRQRPDLVARTARFLAGNPTVETMEMLW